MNKLQIMTDKQQRNPYFAFSYLNLFRQTEPCVCARARDVLHHAVAVFDISAEGKDTKKKKKKKKGRRRRRKRKRRSFQKESRFNMADTEGKSPACAIKNCNLYLSLNFFLSTAKKKCNYYINKYNKEDAAYATYN